MFASFVDLKLNLPTDPKREVFEKVFTFYQIIKIKVEIASDLGMLLHEERGGFLPAPDQNNIQSFARLQSPFPAPLCPGLPPPPKPRL